MPRSVGIAFQGGGARVISLIAAADGISSLVERGDITIERLSGTSAGSLAALLLSGKADFAKVKLAIRNCDEDIKKRFPKPASKGILAKFGKFIAFGTPFYSYKDFNDIIGRILEGAGIDINRQLDEISSNQIPVDIIVSDLLNGRSIPLSTGPLRDVLRRSCAIPMAFASHTAEDQGQFADGGIFDNLPTDILINQLDAEVPVFAVGFGPDKVKSATSSLDYISTVIGSVISYNVARSANNIGKEYVFPVSTKLSTFDFDRMVSVGLNEEYDTIKAATIAYFERWLRGGGAQATQTAGQRATTRLKAVEEKFVRHVETAFRAVPGRYEYVTMSVVANSLFQPSQPDEITIDHLLLIPEGYCLHGTIMPILEGSGSPHRVQCVVKADGPDGADLPFTEFVIEDEALVDGNKIRRSSLLLLFSDNASAAGPRRIYVSKKELRFGFMAPLKSGRDSLGLRSAYWATDKMTVMLTVPSGFGGLQSDWSGRGSSSPVVERGPVADTGRTGWTRFEASLDTVSHHGQLKGNFNLPGG